MVETITLSIPAVDILGERMNLPVRQYPFELPRVGESPEHRSRLEQQVWQELEMAGLARGGSVDMTTSAANIPVTASVMGRTAISIARPRAAALASAARPVSLT